MVGNTLCVSLTVVFESELMTERGEGELRLTDGSGTSGCAGVTGGIEIAELAFKIAFLKFGG
jgi:hypothetical protein